ncbi:MAG: hypothetical protein NVV74_00325 [Magnetospirillum sp.]|nr:hypothetical protein [Magnetospirillum sp.]
MTSACAVLSRGRTPAYLDDSVALFVLAAVFWAIIGFCAGDLIAWQR